MKKLITLILILILGLSLFTQDLSWRHQDLDNAIQAKAGKGYLLMTNSREATFNLPSNPMEGDMTGFLDVSGTFEINPVTVNPGNNLINGTSGTQSYNTANEVVIFIWSNSPYGWKQYYTASSGMEGNVLPDGSSDGQFAVWDASTHSWNVLPESVIKYDTTNNMLRLDTIDINGGATYDDYIFIKKDVATLFNGFTIENASTSNGAKSQVIVANGTGGVLDGVRITAIGENTSTVGGFVEDGGLISSGSNMTGGLSLMTRSGTMRFYVEGHDALSATLNTDKSWDFDYGVNIAGDFTTQNITDDGDGVSISNYLIITPQPSAPSSPSEGMIYINSTTNHAYIYLNSTWNQIGN